VCNPRLENSMNPLLSKVVSDLRERYNPHTIILYGSRARGDYTNASDIDIVCFVDGAAPIKDAREFEGAYLDAWVHTSQEMVASDEMLRVADGYCLYDPEGQGSDFLQQLRQRIQLGPEQLSAAEITHTKQWVRKMLERARQEDVESLYRRYWLAVDLLQIYFDLRGQWYLGPKKSFAWLKEHDIAAYQLFSNAYSPPPALSKLVELAEHVLNI
jgi:predicted nucleotidyltransferase